LISTDTGGKIGERAGRRFQIKDLSPLEMHSASAPPGPIVATAVALCTVSR
jgi:hypothetical protein